MTYPQTNCKNCGAPITDSVCPYCGTVVTRHEFLKYDYDTEREWISDGSRDIFGNIHWYRNPYYVKKKEDKTSDGGGEGTMDESLSGAWQLNQEE